MKKILFTLVLCLSLLGLKAATSTDTTVIFDPAATTIDVAAQGFSIVTIDGVKYLKMVSSEWGPTLTLTDTVKLSAGNTYTFNTVECEAKVVPFTGSTYDNSKLSVVIQPMDTLSGKGLSVSGISSSTFTSYTGSSSSAFVIHKIQFYVQERVNWGSPAGDTIFVGKIKAYKYAYPQATATVFDTIDYAEDFDITDTEADTIWDNATTKNVNKLALGTVAGATGTYQALWNEDYLYLNINVTDATKIDFTGESPWNNDCAEVFIDPYGLHFIGKRMDFQNQIRFLYGSDSITGANISTDISKYGNANLSQGTIQKDQRNTSSGYQFVIKLPWYTTYMTNISDTALAKSKVCVDSAANNIKAGKSISFEVSINNNSTSGTAVRTSIVNWANASGKDTSYTSSGLWGSIVLKKSTSTGISDLKDSKSSLKLYPNPAAETLTVSLTDLKQVDIYSLVGQKVISTSSGSDVLDITVSDLNSGIYILKAYSKSGAAVTGKFVKK
jgi:hypothetical protein